MSCAIQLQHSRRLNLIVIETPCDSYYAIIPAAGRSRRMKRHKLLLPWGDQLPEVPDRKATVIDNVLRAWGNSVVGRVVVVLRQDDQALRQACSHWPVTQLVAQTDPPDMKASIQLGIRYLQNQYQPSANAKLLLAPADLPSMNPEIIDCMVKGSPTGRIAVPRFGDRPGHPIVLPWKITGQVDDLKQNEGIDAVVRRNNPAFLDFPAQIRLTDIDTPDEYQQALEGFSN